MPRQSCVNVRVVRVFGAVKDVTEQKRSEVRIQEAVRRRDQFLAMLSHELRNPLGAIVTATGMLRMAAPGDEAHGRAMGIIDRQSLQMARLLDEVAVEEGGAEREPGEDD